MNPRDMLSQLGNDVASSTQQEYDLPNALRSALMSKFSKDNPLLQQREAALKNYYTAPEDAALKYSQPQTVTIGGGQQPLPGQNPVGEQSTVENVYLPPTVQRQLSAQRQASSAIPLFNLNDIINANYGGIENIIGGVTKGLETQTRAKQSKFDTAFKLVELQQKAGGSGTLAGRQTNILNQVASDAESGMTLKSIMKKYSTQAEIAPEDVLRVYNTNSIYGPAKERLSDLTKYGIKDTRTTEQRNRETALQPAFASINRLKKEKIEGTGPIAWPERFSIKALGGLGARQSLVRQNQSFQLMRQNVVRAMQGARMSDVDIALASQYIPNIGDTSDTIQTKLANLEDILNDIAGNTPGDQIGSSDWEVVE